MCSEGIYERYVNFYTDFAFKKLLFKAAEIAKFDKKERYEYEESLKAYRDWFSVMETAELRGEKRGIEKGLEKGLEQGRAEGLEQGRAKGLVEGEKRGILSTARNLKQMGMAMTEIKKATGLSEEEICQL